MVRRIRGSSAGFGRTLERLKRAEVRVGFFAHSRYEDGTPIAGVAATQELGSVIEKIPARPFFGPAIDQGKTANARGIAKAVSNALAGGDLKQGLELVGQKVVGDIQKKITEVTMPPLSPVTIAARAARHSKGLASTKPLIDTGAMLAAVTYEVDA